MKQNHKEEQQENDLPAPAYADFSKSYEYLGNEDWHGRMSSVEQWERIRFVGLQKLIVSAERAAEIQRRQPYTDVGRPLGISTGNVSRWIVQKIRVPKKLREQSEKALGKHGLSLQQQKLQEAPHAIFIPVLEDTQKYAGATVERFDLNAFAKHSSVLSDTSGIFSLLDNKDLFRGNSQKSLTRQLSFSVVRTRKYERLVPGWMWFDRQFWTVIEAIYPKWKRNELWRERAAKTAAVLYRYFKVLEPTLAIAEDLGMSVRGVENTVARARKMGEQLFPPPQSNSNLEAQIAA
jgi:hypothetical protein